MKPALPDQQNMKGSKDMSQIDDAKIEELKKTSLKLNSLSEKQLPEELLNRVSGGVGDYDEYTELYGICPYCGGETYFHRDHYGSWEVVCFTCHKYIDASWMKK